MHLLFATPRSATLELESTAPYYHEQPFTILVDGAPLRQETRNVFTLFGLAPGSECAVCARWAGGEETLAFALPEEPVTLNVRAFGAAGDGLREDTGAIQAAIAACPPGGRVLLPAGTYLSRPLFLKSHLRLELAAGATLLAVPDRAAYPVLPGAPGGGTFPLGTWEGCAADAFASLITAIGAEDLCLYGEGVIDGNAAAGDWFVDYHTMRTAWRPRGCFFNRCRGVTVQGLTVRNTPSWNQHPFYCTGVKYLNATLQNPPELPTTDGIDPESCDDVQILGCRFSVGDDCIAIKSGKAELAGRYRTPCRRVTVRNCLMQDGHGGVTLGSEMSAGVRELSVSRCRFEHTDRGLRIKTQRGRGSLAVIDQVAFTDIEMVDVAAPLTVNMFYKAGNDAADAYRFSPGPQPVDARTPRLGSFTFRNIRAVGARWAAGYFYGLPEQPIGSITLENVRIALEPGAAPGIPVMAPGVAPAAGRGLVFRNVAAVTLGGVSVTGAATPCEPENVGALTGTAAAE